MRDDFFSLHMLLQECIWTDGGYGLTFLKALADENNQ